MKKIKYFGHQDLDGIGIIPLLNNIGKVDWELHGYDTIDVAVLNFLNQQENNEKYDTVLICDISVNKETAQIIEAIKELRPYSIQLIDHHKTAEHLINYNWCIIKNKTNEFKHSGTELAYHWLISKLPTLELLKSKCTIDYIETIRLWDTFDWVEQNKTIARDLNDLTSIYGFTEFVRKYTEQLKENKFEFNDTDFLLLGIKEERYQEFKKKQMEKLKIKTMIIENKILKYGFLITGGNISRLGNEICNELQEIDFIVFLDVNRGLSFRATKKDINCMNIVKEIGDRIDCQNGGHKLAAGITLKKEKIDEIIEDILKGIIK